MWTFGWTAAGTWTLWWGEQTRMHKDLDLVVLGEQAPRMGEVLSRHGFKHVREPE